MLYAVYCLDRRNESYVDCVKIECENVCDGLVKLCKEINKEGYGDDIIEYLDATNNLESGEYLELVDRLTEEDINLGLLIYKTKEETVVLLDDGCSKIKNAKEVD